jgi:hypothetical protein
MENAWPRPYIGFVTKAFDRSFNAGVAANIVALLHARSRGVQ